MARPPSSTPRRCTRCRKLKNPDEFAASSLGRPQYNVCAGCRRTTRQTASQRARRVALSEITNGVRQLQEPIPGSASPSTAATRPRGRPRKNHRPDATHEQLQDPVPGSASPSTAATRPRGRPRKNHRPDATHDGRRSKRARTEAPVEPDEPERPTITGVLLTGENIREQPTEDIWGMDDDDSVQPQPAVTEQQAPVPDDDAPAPDADETPLEIPDMPPPAADHPVAEDAPEEEDTVILDDRGTLTDFEAGPAPATQGATPEPDGLDENVRLPAAFRTAAGWENKPLILGGPNQVCPRCSAQKWKGESNGNCCADEALILPELPRPDPYFAQLLIGTSPRDRHFQQNLRPYNSVFAFTSVYCNVPPHVRNLRAGPNCFQIMGALYHLTGPLRAGGRGPQHAQAYFYDPVEAAIGRKRLNQNLEQSLLSDISRKMHEENPYTQLYKTAKQRIDDAQDANARFLITPRLELVLEAGADRRRENLPTSDEISILLSEKGDPEAKRSIIVDEKTPTGGRCKQITPSHALYFPLSYPLMWSRGGVGYNWGDKYQDGNRVNNVTIATWTRFHLFARNSYGHLNPFYFRRLFQQFLVDAWAANDQRNLNWLKKNQDKLRADTYKGLHDAISRGDLDPTEIGNKIILPASHIGGDRFMRRCYQDSMAIVRHFGRPTLFVTFTANPKSEAVLAGLPPGLAAVDRPDIVSRAFHLQVKELLADIRQRKIFGDCKAVVWTIEFQKRGLPHLHCLVFLSPRDRDRLLDPRYIDRLISAEIPNPDTDPVLFAKVIKCMNHTPCGTTNPTAPCMQRKEGDTAPSCSRRFPKAFCTQTVVREDGYPEYRRNSGRTAKILRQRRELQIDDRWIVPHNPYLLMRYDAHINVEICASVRAVKYIHKYIYKGSDRVTAYLSAQIDAEPNAQPAAGPEGRQDVDTNDEIGTHLHFRYIGAFEAAWRLLQLRVHDETPAVQRLHIHLPGQNTATFKTGQTAAEIAQDLQDHPEKYDTPLLAWFRYNRANEDGRDLLLHEFPLRYTYKQKDRAWKLREKGLTIGRLGYVPPTAGEAFYLRLLLTAVRGATSYEDLRTVDGVEHPTFRDACVALHLVEDDREYDLALAEAGDFQTGAQIRNLFTQTLLFTTVAKPKDLWEKYRDGMCEDLRHRIERDGLHWIVTNGTEHPEWDFGLYMLQQTLKDQNRELSEFNLPNPTLDWRRTVRSVEFAGEVDLDRDALAADVERLLPQLNEGQWRCFDTVVNAVDNNPENTLFFLQGAAGTGKTFLYKLIASHYRSKGDIVLCVASSGIAALLLLNGRTAHSRFKIPLHTTKTSVCRIRKQQQLGELVRQAKLIIWDEVPMQNRKDFEAVDRTLRDVRDCESPFGSLPVLFGGDFAQILPVVKKGQRAQVVEVSFGS